MANASISAPSSATLKALRQKAYNAFNNAKQRCNNPQNPAYAGYGKLGVKVLFANFEQFLSHIGLPPNAKASLDRIDPTGNYETGNVRWASPSIQAVNKKANPLSSLQSLSHQKAALLDMQHARARREALSKAWSIVVDAINRGGFPAVNAQYLASQKMPPAMFEAGWDPGQVRDLAEPPSYFYLPSLTQLEKRVRMEGGPLVPTTGNHYGVISGLVLRDGAVIETLKQPFLTDENGSVLIGGKGEDWLEVGGIEGIMMIAASRLRAMNRDVSFFPLMAALSELRSIGSPYKWDEVPCRVLDSHSLFIPDFQIDFGDAVQPNHKEWALLAALIDFRLEYGKRTYLGIQNVNKVPGFVREKLLLNFMLRELPEMPAAESLPDNIATGPKPNTIGFETVRAMLTKALYKL